MRYRPGGRAEASAPTEGYKECDGRADVSIGPYGSATRSAVGGPSGTPAPTEAYLVVRRGGALPLPRATARVAPTEGLQGVRWAGRCRHRPLRKCNKRCNGRATARVAPTKALQGVRRGERNPPVTASPCRHPLGKGAYKNGGTDCHTNDTFIVLCVILFGGAAEEKGAEGFAVKGQQGV